MNAPKAYWFPAKRRGWGWGFPTTWQGRAALAVFYGLIALGAATLLPHYGNMVFVVYCGILCIVLIAVSL